MNLLSVKDVALRLQVTPRTVYWYIAEDRITYTKVGGTYIFHEADLAGFQKRPLGRPRKTEKSS